MSEPGPVPPLRCAVQIQDFNQAIMNQQAANQQVQQTGEALAMCLESTIPGAMRETFEIRRKNIDTAHQMIAQNSGAIEYQWKRILELTQ